jgi:hypothetical protein
MQWLPARMQTSACVYTRALEDRLLMQEFAIRDAREISNRKATILSDSKISLLLGNVF